MKQIFGDTLVRVDMYEDDPPSPYDSSLACLKEMWQIDDTIIPERKEMYSDVLESLIRAYQRSFQRQKGDSGRKPGSGVLEFAQTCRWLPNLSDSFVQLLEQHGQPALVLMCHYTKLLDNISLSFWWTHLNSQICISRIRRVLDTRWHK